MGILQRLFGKKNSDNNEHASTKSARESEWKIRLLVPVEAEEAFSGDCTPESHRSNASLTQPRNPKIISVIASDCCR